VQGEKNRRKEEGKKKKRICVSNKEREECKQTSSTLAKGAKRNLLGGGVRELKKQGRKNTSGTKSGERTRLATCEIERKGGPSCTSTALRRAKGQKRC